MRLLLGLLLLLAAPLLASSARAQPAGDLPPSRAGDARPASDYEAALTDLLGQVVMADGRVRYDLLRGPLNEDFRRVLKAVETYDAARLGSQEEKLAFWMNAYNVQMLQNIVETPAAQNIEQGGYAEAFFRTPLRTAGRALTLDQIENVLLRREDGPEALQPLQVETLDPRIHAGLNCAAVGCPRLRRRTFTPQNVGCELDAAMRDFTASLEHFRATSDGFVLSSLLDWFGTDFDRAGKPAGTYLLDFMPKTRPHYDRLESLLRGRSAEAIKARPGVSFAYDWSVNRAEAP